MVCVCVRAFVCLLCVVFIHGVGFGKWAQELRIYLQFKSWIFFRISLWCNMLELYANAEMWLESNDFDLIVHAHKFCNSLFICFVCFWLSSQANQKYLDNLFSTRNNDCAFVFFFAFLFLLSVSWKKKIK